MVTRVELIVQGYLVRGEGSLEASDGPAGTARTLHEVNQ